MLAQQTSRDEERLLVSTASFLTEIDPPSRPLCRRTARALRQRMSETMAARLTKGDSDESEPASRRRRRRLISTTHRIRRVVADERTSETHLMKLQTNRRATARHNASRSDQLAARPVGPTTDGKGRGRGPWHGGPGTMDEASGPCCPVVEIVITKLSRCVL